MSSSPNIAALAAPLADPARARMVTLLMDGRARTVTELGAAVGLTKASASEHATKLLEARLVKAERQGRHKYLTLASAEVARLIEAMMALAGAGAAYLPQTGSRVGPSPGASIGPRDPALREARLCYNHLAGALGVQVYQSLSSRGYLAHAPGGLELTQAGRAFCLEFGLAEGELAPAAGAQRAPLCRDCLDWSERQSHLGGRLGRLLLQRFEARGWLRRQPDSRALIVTPEGRRALAVAFPRSALAFASFDQSPALPA